MLTLWRGKGWYPVVQWLHCGGGRAGIQLFSAYIVEGEGLVSSCSVVTLWRGKGWYPVVQCLHCGGGRASVSTEGGVVPTSVSH